MEQFCSEYRRLEELLKNKGIVSRHVSIMPPSEEYAMIINTSDYNMTIQEPDQNSNSRS